jgi:hypothetical protein
MKEGIAATLRGTLPPWATYGCGGARRSLQVFA